MSSVPNAEAIRWSLIIPAHNAAEVLVECLGAIDALESRPWEVIVVDDASTDATVSVAETWGAQVIRVERNSGPGTARNIGARHATGDVLVFIDADIVVRADTLEAIAGCLRRNPDAGAVTGCLDGEAPVNGYFSRYKNRYMAYVFSRLPEHVDFLFASVAAVRREIFTEFIETPTATEDTELGQRLNSAGVKIVFCDALRVVHLKRYSLLSFYRNDFVVPFSWVSIFLADLDPLALIRKRRFAHASLLQILGLVLASLSVVCAAAWWVGWLPYELALTLMMAAIGTNVPFLLYLARHEGAIFALAAIVVSFVDQLVMTAGIVAGFCSRLLRSV